MLQVEQIENRLAGVLNRGESISAFEQWLSQESASLNINDVALLDLADSILSPLQMYSDKLIDELQLRQELRNLSQKHEVQERELVISFLDDQQPRPRRRLGFRSSGNSPIQVEHPQFAL